MVGAPHPVLGEDVVAFVVLHAGARRSTATRCAVSAWSSWPTTRCRASSCFVDELPRNATGKVIKPRAAPQLAETITRHSHGRVTRR